MKKTNDLEWTSFVDLASPQLGAQVIVCDVVQRSLPYKNKLTTWPTSTKCPTRRQVQKRKRVMKASTISQAAKGNKSLKAPHKRLVFANRNQVRKRGHIQQRMFVLRKGMWLGARVPIVVLKW